MNVVAINLVFGVVALLSLAITGLAFWLKAKAEQMAQAKILLVPKLEGQIEELHKTADGLSRQVEAGQQADKQREAVILDLTAKLSAAQTEGEQARLSAQRQIEAERNALQQIIAQKDEQAAELKEFIASSQEQQKTVFANTATESLDKLMKQFETQTSGNFKLREQKLDEVVNPLKERLDSVLKRCETSDLEIQKAKEAFEIQIRGLKSTTSGLANALKRPDIRGDWGEMALQNALDCSGLKEGLHYTCEHTTTEDQERRRADVVVNLPKGERIVIDSKAPFSTYDEAVNADPSQRKLLIEKHARGLKAHIATLAGKEYHKRYQGPDFVIMFLPHEGMLLAALEGDPKLIQYASERKVYIATTITLTAALGAVGHLVRIEQLNQNAEEIKKTGQDLYASIAIFAEHYGKVGRGLSSAVSAFNQSVGTMEGRFIKNASKFKELGISGRELPEVPPLEISPREFTKPELANRNEEDLSA